ncbi:MAG: hypothetical protein A2Z12_08265 [Actinobacteria bacterium RBG_16_68_21]|nr:MAG: hypothetical protein A2Z12_08265 [Actinobacteria bacterium RBG_16_68_21]
MDDGSDLSEAARRGLQRAAVHMMKAAIEVVAGISAFLEEMGSSSAENAEGRDHGEGDPQHIPVE